MAEKTSAKVLTSMILPAIDYWDVLYSVSTQNTQNLQYAFNRGLKTTYIMDEFPVEASLKKCNVNKLEDRRTMHLNTAAFDFCLHWF